MSLVETNHDDRKGVADEQLAKKDEQRRQEKTDPHQWPAGLTGRRRRSHSMSSRSSSVSTISTNRSRSSSPRRGGLEGDARYFSQRSETLPAAVSEARSKGRKRARRSSSSSMSYSSASSYERGDRSKSRDRNTRRRRSSHSPGERGRRRGSTRSRERRDPRRSRSMSFDHHGTARIARSPPGREAPRDESMRDARENDRYGGDVGGEKASEALRYRAPPAAPPRKERSLSPFSKRLALTQAMNMGR